MSMHQVFLVEKVPVFELTKTATLVTWQKHLYAVEEYNRASGPRLRNQAGGFTPVEPLETLTTASRRTLEFQVEERHRGRLAGRSSFDTRLAQAAQRFIPRGANALNASSIDFIDSEDEEDEVESGGLVPGPGGSKVIFSSNSGEIEFQQKSAEPATSEGGAAAPASSASLVGKGVPSSSAPVSTARGGGKGSPPINEEEVLQELYTHLQPKSLEAMTVLLKSIKQLDSAFTDFEMNMYINDFMEIYARCPLVFKSVRSTWVNVLWYSLPKELTAFLKQHVKIPKTLERVVQMIAEFLPLFREMQSVMEKAQTVFRLKAHTPTSPQHTPKAAPVVAAVTSPTAPAVAPAAAAKPSTAPAAVPPAIGNGWPRNKCCGCGHVTSPPHRRGQCKWKHLPGWQKEGCCTTPLVIPAQGAVCAALPEGPSSLASLPVGTVAEAQGLVSPTMAGLKSGKAITTKVGLDSYSCHSLISPGFALRLQAYGAKVSKLSTPYVVGVAGGSQVACSKVVQVCCSLQAPQVRSVRFEAACIVAALPPSVNILLSWDIILKKGLQPFMPGFGQPAPVSLAISSLQEPPASEEVEEEFEEVTYPLPQSNSPEAVIEQFDKSPVPVGVVAAFVPAERSPPQSVVDKLQTLFPQVLSKPSVVDVAAACPLIAFEDPGACYAMARVVLAHPTVFSDVFPSGGTELPAMQVEMKDSAVQPQRVAPRRYPPAISEFVTETIHSLLALNFIKVSKAPNPSPIVVARSANRNWRLCIDYTAVNECTQRLPYPLPNVKDLLFRMRQFCWYAKLDLKKGFHQIALDPASRKYSAFVCPDGLYEWNVIPFGFINGPPYFQMLLSTVVLIGYVGFFCLVYIDDMIVGGNTPLELVENVNKVVIRLEQYGLIVNTSKCSVGVQSIEYLGQTLSKLGIDIPDGRRQGFHQLVPPRDLKTLRSVLGLFNYFRDYIPSFAVVAAPLYAMTKKGVEFGWKPEHQQAFDALRDAVIKAPMLYHMDYSLPVIVRTDASCVAIGGTIVQPAADGERTVATISRLLSPAACKWSTRDQEAYAVYFCIHAWSCYLLGHRFVIETDHRNLTFIMKATEGRVYRWKIYLQQFDYLVTHIPGVDNVVADGLSRCVLAVTGVPEGRDVLKDLGAHSLPLDIKPEHLQMLKSVHNDLVGHFGIEYTIRKLRDKGHQWATMRRDVVDFLHHCVECQKLRVNAVTSQAHGARQVIETYEPFEMISIDTLSCPPDEDGYNCILVAICNFTRYVELVAAADHTASTWASFLLRICCRFGSPRYIHSDKGSEFVNTVISEFNQLFKCTQRFTIGYRPQANGMAERINREIIRHLAALVLSDRMGRTWSLGLPIVNRIINAHDSAATGIAPATLVYGGVCNLDRGLMSSFQPAGKATLNQYTSALLQYQANAILASQRHLAVTMDCRVGDDSQVVVTIPVGTYVVVSYAEVAPRPNKFLSPWRGPHLVESRHHNDYTLKDLRTKKCLVVDASRLKVFKVGKDVDPVQVAGLDEDEDVVDSITDHRNLTKKRGKTAYEFQVQWQVGQPTWEPYANIRNVEALDEYLADHPQLKAIVDASSSSGGGSKNQK